MQIVFKNPNTLIPYDKNSRVHSDYQINQIAKSIKELGWRVPVVVDNDNILSGHGRVLAAQKLGMTEIPTIDASDMTDVQKKQFIIADNKIAQNAEWDKEILMMEIEELKELGADLDVLGFDASEVKINDIDYSILDDETDIEEKLNSLERETRRAIELVFQEEHYEEAYEIIKWWKNQGAYTGYMVMRFLQEEKQKTESE